GQMVSPGKPRRLYSRRDGRPRSEGIQQRNGIIAMQQADVAIVGGGIVGLATAYRLQERFPGQRVVILEKEREVAQHQTGHNSGVLHSGIYYKPGSLRALNCREGKLAMQEFCDREGIPYELCGKVIVAVNQ